MFSSVIRAAMPSSPSATPMLAQTQALAVCDLGPMVTPQVIRNVQTPLARWNTAQRTPMAYTGADHHACIATTVLAGAACASNSMPPGMIQCTCHKCTRMKISVMIPVHR